MKQKFKFLCGNFSCVNLIYGVKFANHKWHYFQEVHNISSVHDALPIDLNALISSLREVKTIEIALDEEQSNIYYKNGKFIFKDEELKTSKPLESVVIFHV